MPAMSPADEGGVCWSSSGSVGWVGGAVDSSFGVGCGGE